MALLVTVAHTHTHAYTVSEAVDIERKKGSRREGGEKHWQVFGVGDWRARLAYTKVGREMGGCEWSTAETSTEIGK